MSRHEFMRGILQGSISGPPIGDGALTGFFWPKTRRFCACHPAQVPKRR